MRIDCHIHTTYGEVTQEAFLSRLDQAGVDGVLFSPRVPPDFRVLIFLQRKE